MCDPPHRQKYGQQQAIEPLSVLDQAGFQIPATTLPILKGRLDSHAPGILLDPSPACRSIRNQEPGFLTVLVPDGTQIGLDGVVLPQQDSPIPLLSFGPDDMLQGTPPAPALSHPSAARLLLAHPQQIMELAITAQVHQRQPCQATIRNQSAVCRLQMQSH